MLFTLGRLKLEAAELQTKPALLLAYLALEGTKTRHHLRTLFWPAAADPAHSLRVALRGLKQVVPELDVTGAGVTAVLPSDAQALLGALEKGDIAGALLRYHGPFLDGAEPGRIGPELEEWMYGTREFLARSLQSALLRFAEHEAVAGRVTVAAAHAERAYGLAGAPALEPDELARLYALLTAGGSPRAADLRREAAEVGLALTPAAPAFALAATPVTTLGAPPVANLPVRTTPFVGRDLELLEVARLLAHGDLRCLTLTGPGGVGKTRLALQAAREELKGEGFPGGVVFAALENVPTPDGLPGALAAALGLTPGGRTDTLDAVAETVGERALLLLLDNFEQLLGGVPLVLELLSRCPNLKLLVTSRERLNLAEEWVLPVSGMSVPPELASGDAPRHDAVQLFVARAKRASLTFSLTPENTPHVLEICRLVGGSPLGIELAAAWVRMFSPADIAQEITGDLDFLSSAGTGSAARHRSVRAAFEHSWRALTPKEQAALGGLSVFRDGFRRDAASRVVGATIPVLASLVDKSLLRVAVDGRYDRHPLIFGYAAEKLDGPRRKRLRAAHAGYYLALAEELDANLRETRDLRELDTFEQEHENLRAALAWSLDEAGDLALRLGGALGRFWETRGYLGEGRRWLEGALTRHPGAPVAVRAAALTALGRLTFLQGDTAPAEALFTQGLELWRQTGNPSGIAGALNRLGTAALAREDYGRAEACFLEGLALNRALGEAGDVMILLNNLGELARARTDYVSAAAFYEESLQTPQAARNVRPRAIVLGNLGFVAGHLGDWVRAERCLKESLMLKYEVRDEIGLSYCSPDLPGSLANLVSLNGRRSFWASSKRRSRGPNTVSTAPTRLRPRSAPAPAAFCAAQDTGRSLSLAQAVSYALA